MAKPTKSAPYIGMQERLCRIVNFSETYKCQPTQLLNPPRMPPHGDGIVRYERSCRATVSMQIEYADLIRQQRSHEGVRDSRD